MFRMRCNSRVRRSWNRRRGSGCVGLRRLLSPSCNPPTAAPPSSSLDSCCVCICSSFCKHHHPSVLPLLIFLLGLGKYARPLSLHYKISILQLPHKSQFSSNFRICFTTIIQVTFFNIPHTNPNSRAI